MVMTKTVKIVIGISAALSVIALFAFSSKARTTAKKAVSKILVGDSSTATPNNQDLAKGSGDVQHILQLQQLLNELHTAVQYINANCGIQWPLYGGRLPDVSGIFDDTTQAATQFYLARATVDLDYLNDIRAKLNKYQSGDNKCTYPLSL